MFCSAMVDAIAPSDLSHLASIHRHVNGHAQARIVKEQPDLLDPLVRVTTQPVTDPGLIWAELSGEHERTGLVPVLRAAEEDDARLLLLPTIGRHRR